MKAVLLVVALVLALASAQSVLDLTNDNFDQTLQEHKKIMVEFFAPWCGHCKQLAPQYDAAAKQLGSNGVLAKVDCTVEGDLCNRFGVRGYPTLKFFSNGKPSDYTKGRTAKDIVSFVSEQNKPAVSSLATVEEVEKFVKEAGYDVVAVLFGTDASVFTSIAEELRNDFSFGSSSNTDAAKHFGLEDGTGVVIFKKFDEPRVVYTGALTEKDFSEFLHAESFPLVGNLGPESYRRYVERNLPLLYIFIDPSKEAQKDLVASTKDIAKDFKGKVSFVDIDGVQYGRHGESLGLSGQVTPSVILHDMAKKEKFIYDESKEVTVAELRKFVTAWSKGELEPFFKSEPIPETNDGDVKVIVGKNFKELVLDSSQNVLVEFYAPWCGHCKSLKPIYEKLGAQFKDDSSVIIGAVDATANDVPVEIEGFPTILFYPAGDKSNPIPYEGDRSLDAMAKFVQEHSASSSGKPQPHDEL
eukprot:TRINITY_DN154_c0_g1_i2.p2 TRINITY_DN154_c0_g1~~TRINITY_DN154_c0_g1_i2.p2  ORF type:complete len:470 (+),score=215.22 TRINITY_DN154_c0_g1_i2:71-1480(+)